MTNLDPVADMAVRAAVDAFMEGRLTPELPGETVFETKNSRYRLLDGIVFAAPDDALIGSELVGWLMESRRHSVVESAWQPGSRAVLVDRHRGRNIIVTSTTRLLHLEEHASMPPPPRHPDRAPSPAFSPRNAPVVPSTPPPSQAAPAPAVASPPPRPAPQPPAPRPSSPIQSAVAVQKRAIHLPPRPIAPRPAASPSPSQPAARSLPVPAPPPRRDASSPAHVSGQGQPVDDPGWELTSSEFEVEGDPPRPERALVSQATMSASVPGPAASPNAPLHGARHSSKHPMKAPESASDAPIPLVRPLHQGGPSVPRPRR
jgi:hypothetical protein